MEEKHLHIISFNIPYPANYGGVVDVYYRLKALSEAGVKITLHCFQYGREEARELNELCEKVFYYKRPKSIKYQFSILPFIVNTRSEKMLLENLKKDDYPILFEGLHSCYFLSHKALKSRKKIVRSHNIEHEYYDGLAQNTKAIKEKLFFNVESKRLKRFEKVLNLADHIGAISKADFDYLQSNYGNTFLMPPSHPSEEITIKSGKGDYVLYHGNLSVHENIDAVHYLLSKVVGNVKTDFVIAGKNPPESIRQKVGTYSNVRLVENPSDSELHELINNAHINLLPTFQATGFKLKLLNALFNGRFCSGTPDLVAGTGLDQCCVIGNSDKELISLIEELLKKEFTTDEVEKRKKMLNHHRNSASTYKLFELL